MSQAVEWLRRPTRIQKIKNFTPWNCNNNDANNVLPCEVKCLNILVNSWTLFKPIKR